MPASLRDIISVATLGLAIIFFTTACQKATHAGGGDVGGHEQPVPSSQKPDKNKDSEKIDSSDVDAATNQEQDSTGNDDNDVVDPYVDSDDDPREDNVSTDPVGDDELRDEEEPQTTATPPAKPAVDNINTFKLGNLVVTMPSGWTLHQEAVVGGTSFLGFAKGGDYVRLYTSSQQKSLSQIFGSTGPTNQVGDFEWEFVKTSGSKYSVAGFGGDQDGSFYYGFGKSTNSSTAEQALTSFLESLK